MKPDIVAQPQLTGKEVNSMTEELVADYKKYLRMYLAVLVQDGVPGMLPPENRDQELASIAMRMPMLLSVAGDMTAPEGMRDRARKEIQRGLTLTERGYAESV